MASERSTLLGVPRDLAVLSLALVAWGIGEGMFLYIQPIYLQSFGAEPVEIGAALSMVGVAMTLAQVPAGAISDRIGALPIMRAAWVTGLLAGILMALARSLNVFIAGMVLYGITSFVSAPLSSYQTQARGHWRVEQALTVIGAVYNLGIFLGALSGGWIGEQFGLQNIYRAASVLFAISTVFLFRARPQQAQAQPEPHAAQQPHLAANPRFLGLLAVIVFSLFALYLPQPLTPIYLRNQHNFSVQAVGQIGAVASLSNAFILLVLGSLLRARVGLIVGLVLVGLFSLLFWQGSSAWMFYLGYSFLGGFRIYRSMILAYVRTTVRASQTGLAFGLIETGNGLSVILAPLAAGFLYERSPQSVYMVSLAAIAAALAFHLIQMRSGRSPFNGQTGPYQDAATAGPIQIDNH